MTRTLLPALGALLAASCLVPSMEIVDSLGDSGDGGEGAAGASAGAGGKGSSGNAGSSPGAGGAGRSGQGGTGGNPAGGTSQDAGASGAEDSAGTNAGGRGSGGSAGAQSNGGAANGGSDNGPGGDGGNDGGSSGTSAGGASGSGNAGSGGSAGSDGGAGGGSNAGTGGSGPVVSCNSYNVAADGYVAAPQVVDDCIKGFSFTAFDNGTQAMPESFEACGMGCVLGVTGMVGPANEENTYSGYFLLGVNLNQDRSGTKGQFTPHGFGLRVTYTHVGDSDLRAQIEVGNTRWCAALPAAAGEMIVNIPYSSFTTECFLPGGSAYAGQPIEAFELVLPGDQTAQMFSLTLHAFEEY